MEYASLQNLWEQHAVNITAHKKKYGARSIAPGIFADCNGTLFDSNDQIVKPVYDFFMATRQERNMRGIVVSASPMRYFTKLRNETDIDSIEFTPINEKRFYKNAPKGFAVEFLLDDETSMETLIPHVTHITPENLLKILPSTV